jgi:calcium-dependent protein kinase
MSPEVLVAEYDEKCDIWSAGVILYILLVGDPPFGGNSEMEIYKKIESIDYSFPKEIWKNISDDAKDLISKMICKSHNRLSAESVLKHKWLEKRTTEYKPLPTNFLDNIIAYSKYNKIKKAVLTYIASRLSEAEVKLHKNYFHRIDINNDGLITLDEFKQGTLQIN